jgi:hypothetical protein
MDFIDANLIVTGLPENRISKNEMHKRFKEQFPLKMLTVLQLIGDLKDKKIIYNAKFRCSNIQGCFIGVKFREGSDEEPMINFNSDNEALNASREMCNDFKRLYEEASISKEKFRKQAELLQNQNSSLISNKHTVDIYDEDYFDDINSSDYYPYFLPTTISVTITPKRVTKKVKAVKKEEFVASESDFNEDDENDIMNALAQMN